MRKISAIFIMLSLAFLTGCAILDVFPPDEATIDGKRYRTGFYENLYPHKLSFTGEEYQVGSHTFQQMATERFDWVRLDKGPKVGGTIYCVDSQWEEAKAYYADNGNFTFYCEIGTPKEGQETITKVIENMDYGQFEALAAFSDENEYTPVSPKTIEGQQTIRIPDSSQAPRLIFYKVSKDGLFTSLQHKYYIIDGKMYLVRYYKYKEGNMHVIEIPPEIAAFFISLME